MFYVTSDKFQLREIWGSEVGADEGFRVLAYDSVEKSIYVQYAASVFRVVEEAWLTWGWN